MTYPSKSDKWLKAAVIGSLWGASEIVLGSFLHNLKIPFSGNLLTSIGIVIMIAGHRLWPERGIIIRAGLICAALKTMSPSASIMGPMIAITMQATLMETALLVGRSTWFGYLLGGGLAMSWNIFHRIFTSIVLYGGTLIELYKSLIDYFIRQTGWQVEGYLAPILLLSAIFFVTGMAAATAGIYISRLAQNYRQSAPGINLQNAAETDKSHLLRRGKGNKGKQQQGNAIEQGNDLPGYAILLRIIAIIALLVTAMMSITRLPLAIAAAILLTYLFAVWKYDIRLLGRFIYKKGFWISMGIMLLLSALLLRQDQSDTAFSLAGLQAGVAMIMRAMYVITGFGLLSKELRSKSLVTWFESMHMKGFLDAIRLSFQTTPLIIENMPEKSSWRRPTQVLSTMLAGMEDVYDQMRRGEGAKGRGGDEATGRGGDEATGRGGERAKGREGDTFIITGTKGSGKSTLLAAVVQELKKKGVPVIGILAPELVEHSERVGYYVQDADSGERMVLCRKERGRDEETKGRRDEERERGREDGAKGGFVFDARAIAFGEKLLDKGQRQKEEFHAEAQSGKERKEKTLRSSSFLSVFARKKRTTQLLEIMVIDELGPYELKGQGWASAMDHLQETFHGPMIWVVRESLVENMLKKWPSKNHKVFHVNNSMKEEIIPKIIKVVC